MLLEVSILVQGDEANNNKSNINPMLHSVVPLSFWGGVDPLNGQVIDHTHPWYRKNIANMVVAIPSGRGSCTGSQVMLELILNGAAPSIVITREVDPILCVAAIIAQEVFVTSSAAAQDYPLLKIPTIISVGEDGFKQIGEDLFCGNIEGQSSGFCRLLTEDDTTAHKPDNSRHTTRSAFLAFGKTEEQVRETAALGLSTNAVWQHATQSLALTPEEQSILDGTYSNSNKYQSKAHQVAMRTVVRIANIVKAKELIPITQAHIDACTYIGKGGLAFVNELVSMGGKVTVPTSLNSISVDRRRWEQLNVPPTLGIPAYAVSEAYLKLGGNAKTFTCAPYALPQSIHPLPKFGEHIAWGESNAVIYSNSVMGARTLKYPDYLDICAALVGRVPAYGAHLEEHRRPTIVLDVHTLIQEQLPFLLSDNKILKNIEAELDAFFPLLGYVCGILSDSRVPLIIGLESCSIDNDQLKSFSAAFGTTGSAALFHMAGITPDAKANDNWTAEVSALPCVKVTLLDMQKAFGALDSVGVNLNGTPCTDSTPIDLVALGNPHLSLTECQEITKMLASSEKERNSSKGLRKHHDVKVMATLGRSVYNEAVKNGYIDAMTQFGFEFINDTCWCMLTEPVVPVNPDAIVMTNSGKYAHYAPALVKKQVRFGSMAACLRAAQTGIVSSTAPSWLLSRQHRRFTSHLAVRQQYLAKPRKNYGYYPRIMWNFVKLIIQ